MDQLNSVLVGIDFAPSCSAALTEAARLASASNATLRAIHVIDTLVVVDLEEALSEYQRDIQENLLSDVKLAWEKFDPALAAKAGVPLKVVIGNPVQSILAAIAREKIDLLVLGVQGNATGAGIGELAAACVRRSPTKVLLTRDNRAGPYRNIVVGVDFSALSLKALEAAEWLAEGDQATLHVVHVYHPPWRRLRYFAPTHETSPEFQQQYRDALLGRLEALAEELKDHAAAKTQFHLVEHVSDGRGISEFAAKNKADLLVVGTHGRSNLSEVLLGSTAERVLKQAMCSILTVRG
ncbi:MAG: universal stress protein [Pyrinomonadaceae bacterium]|nr:universal stress protein [Phycisphaerales bacterium]